MELYVQFRCSVEANNCKCNVFWYLEEKKQKKFFQIETLVCMQMKYNKNAWFFHWSRVSSVSERFMFSIRHNIVFYYHFFNVRIRGRCNNGNNRNISVISIWCHKSRFHADLDYGIISRFIWIWLVFVLNSTGIPNMYSNLKFIYNFSSLYII